MKNGTIILVDDDTDDQELLVNVFESLRIPNEVLIFENGHEALLFLKQTPSQPFLIICDVNMPIMNGLELRRQINSNEFLRRKSIPFIFLSTSGDINAVIEAYELDVQGFFVKERYFEGIQEQIKQIVEYWKKCKHPNSDKQ
jgi:CheY-like chemotaxis protein